MFLSLQKVLDAVSDNQNIDPICFYSFWAFREEYSYSE